MNDKQIERKDEAARYEGAAMLPPVDVIEDATGITLYADLPGVPKDRLTVRAFTMDGLLYDAFQLDKTGQGAARLTDLKPATPELILRREDR